MSCESKGLLPDAPSSLSCVVFRSSLLDTRWCEIVLFFHRILFHILHVFVFLHEDLARALYDLL